MSTEPVYEYVKGQGWVTVTNVFFYTDFYGKRVRAEIRMPKFGECYYLYNKSTTVDISQAIEHLKTRGWSEFSCRGGNADDHYTGKTLIVLSEELNERLKTSLPL